MPSAVFTLILTAMVDGRMLSNPHMAILASRGTLQVRIATRDQWTPLPSLQLSTRLPHIEDLQYQPVLCWRHGSTCDAPYGDKRTQLKVF